MINVEQSESPLYLYVSGENSFYPYSMLDSYVEAGTWPSSGVNVDMDTHKVFSANPPEGQQLGADAKGYPTWIPVQPSKYHEWDGVQWFISEIDQRQLKKEELDRLERDAIGQISALRTQCDKDILPLQDAVDLDEATQEERDKLIALKRYRIALNRWEYPQAIPQKL